MSTVWLRRVLAGAALGALLACGQKGDLFLPTDAAAQGRASLPQTLDPRGTPTAPARAPSGPAPGGGTGTGTAAPVRTP